MISPKQTRWKEITDELRNELGQSRFKQGDRFYSLQDICARYEVSLGTATRVCTELENEGWVRRHWGKGTIVMKRGVKTQIKVLVGEELSDARARYRILEIYSGLSEAAQKFGCEPIRFSNARHFLKGSEKNEPFIVFQEVDGFDADENLEVLKNGRNFTVVVHAYSFKENYSSVGIDFRKGAFLAVDHLFSLGHTRIALLTDQIATPWLAPRFDGYVDGLKKHERELDWNLVKETNSDVNGIYRSLDELRSLRHPPTALFATNDAHACHILEYCKRHGIRVPEDLSVIGFDNDPEAAVTDPPLTTIDTRLKQMGREAVHLVLDLMHGKRSNQNLLVQPELTLRQSTAPRVR